VNDALNQTYIEEEDLVALKESINTYDNFEPLVLAKQLKGKDLLEARRIAAFLYQKHGRWEESVQLSKDDFLYKDAMATAAASGDPEVVDSLLRYFISEKLYECFAACLYTCYDLVKPDVAMELSWKAGQMNLTMPYMIQVIHDFTSRVDSITPHHKKSKKGGQADQPVMGTPVQAVGIDPNTGLAFSPGAVDPNFYNPVVLGGGGVLPPGMMQLPPGQIAYVAPPGSGGAMYVHGPPSGPVYTSGSPSGSPGQGFGFK